MTEGREELDSTFLENQNSTPLYSRTVLLCSAEILTLREEKPQLFIQTSHAAISPRRSSALISSAFRSSLGFYRNLIWTLERAALLSSSQLRPGASPNPQNTPRTSAPASTRLPSGHQTDILPSDRESPYKRVKTPTFKEERGSVHFSVGQTLSPAGVSHMSVFGPLCFAPTTQERL